MERIVTKTAAADPFFVEVATEAFLNGTPINIDGEVVLILKKEMTYDGSPDGPVVSFTISPVNATPSPAPHEQQP